MNGSKKIAGTVHIEDKKGYQTPSKIVAASTTNTSNGGSLKVVADDSALTAAQSLRQSLGLLGGSLDGLSKSMEYRNNKIEAEKERQKRKAEYEAEKAANKAEREAELQRRDDAFLRASTTGLVEHKKFAENYYDSIMSDDTALENLEGKRDAALEELRGMYAGASKEDLYASRGLISNTAKYIIDTTGKRMSNLRSNRTTSDTMALFEDGVNPDLFADQTKAIIKQNVDMGGSVAEGRSLILDSAIKQMGIYSGEMSLDKIEELRDTVSQSSLFDKFSDEYFEWEEKADRIESVTDEFIAKDQKEYADRAELDAVKLSKGLTKIEDVDSKLEYFAEYTPKDRYEKLWVAKNQAALASRRQFLSYKNGKYNEVLSLLDNIAATKFKGDGIGLGDGSTLEGVAAGKVVTLTGSKELVPLPLLMEAKDHAAENFVNYAVEHNLDPKSADTRAKAVEFYQNALSKYGIDITDPHNIEKLPYEEWTKSYVSDNKKVLWQQIIDKEKAQPGNSIVEVINDVIPDQVPNHQFYRNLFYDKYIVKGREDYSKQQTQKFIDYNKQVDAEREAEMASQQPFMLDAVELADKQAKLGGGLGSMPVPDEVFDHKDDVDTVDIGIISNIVGMTKLTREVLGVAFPGFKMSDDDELSLPYSDDTYAAAVQVMREEKGIEDPFAGKTRVECIDLIEQLDIEGKIKAVRLKAYNEVIKEQSKELYRVKDENGKLRDVVLNNYEKQRGTSIRIGGNKEYIEGVLKENGTKNFVKRILTPEKYPVLDNEDGSYSTHSMSWAEAEGKYYVYPTVVQSKNGKMVRLKDEEAWENAISTKEFIEFDSADDADWFSKSYKEYWDN